ncbi:MAG: NUDIX domain-containing protein [Lachnospiraceae bacterium]|nr:NUDIX domain-containing protein [Lachnospiraceae bacterium]
MPEDGYHLVVHIWIRNAAGQYLMTQRSANKKTFPLAWECVGGSVVKGEESLAEASTDEVAQARWMARDEIVELYRQGKMVSVIKDLSYFIENTDGVFV